MYRIVYRHCRPHGMRYFSVQGAATTQGTHDFHHRFPISAKGFQGNLVSSHHWKISPIGFGSFKINSNNPQHQYALQYAIQSGCNIIDTSSNFQNYESEEVIGNVLEGMIGEKIIKREEMVIVTKIGHIQGLNLHRIQQREEFEEFFYEDVIKFDEHKNWYCISPQFIEDQLNESLERLCLQTVDVLLLQNPELCWKQNESETEFYEKMKKAFTKLEQLVQQGKIQKYGIYSPCLPTTYKNRFISLEKCISIAKSITPHPHFEFIEFPYNFEEAEAYTQKHYNDKNLFDYARENHITTITSRPFTAYFENMRKMIRYTELPSTSVGDISKVNQLLNELIHLEVTFPAKSELDVDKNLPTKKSLSWGTTIGINLSGIDNYFTFDHNYKTLIVPSVEEALYKLRKNNQSHRYADFVVQYKYVFTQFAQTFKTFLAYKHNKECEKMIQEMDTICPELKSNQKLSQKVIRVLASSGPDCVLVGMREKEYVEDVMHYLNSKIENKEQIDNLMKNIRWKSDLLQRTLKAL